MSVGRLQMRPAAQARLFWPSVRADLERIAARFDEAWMPEDVWAEIAAGTAYLWVAGTPDAIESWIVFQVQQRAYDRCLHIWNAAENTTAKGAEWWPQILEIAAEANCTHVTIESARRWERALPGMTVRYLYSAKVQGGSDVGGQ